ncbi:hypothetical protein NEMIN01_1170 [Nematocida minor]|uniref:uncharacterized protein n=1 Tax=Nematocida minor TaxID=1912983 RepID=UPI00221E993C|nr:uncharacterized protein NEMIN01_1170 [Nematocida minor]KAI5190705.1 hypothetical protein NEMIN01_1170 [Nematocida minor]
MANANKASESEGKRSPLLQKETPIEKVAISDALSLMHGWRFVPDEIELKKRMLYALAVGFECLSIWVYKQIIPYADKYGSAEFESTIFPKLMQGQAQTKYAQAEIRQEIEKNIIALGRRMYGQHLDIFLAKDLTKEQIKGFIEYSSKGVGDKSPVRVLFCLLKLLITEIEESDIRTIELIVFLGHILDSRIFDYLVSYFHKEKDLLLEILLVKMKYRVIDIPCQKHLTDEDIGEIFGALKKVSYTEEEEEKLAKKIVLDLSDEVEVTSANFFIMRALVYIKCKPDQEILQKMIEKMKNKNKAVRMQCVIILQAFAEFEGVTDALIAALDDADDDIKNQARVSLSVAIPTTQTKKEELIDYYTKWIIDEKYDYIEQLPEILLTAKETGHAKHSELYGEYCALLEKETGNVQVQLAQKIVKIFSLYIREEDLITENMINMKIEEKKGGQIVFPSPDMSAEGAAKKYSVDKAVHDLEEIVNIFMKAGETAECVVEMLPELRKLFRNSFTGKVLETLYERDPERNWRYWMNLLKTTEKIKEHIGETQKDRIKKRVKELTRHWASAVRAEAKRVDGLF